MYPCASLSQQAPADLQCGEWLANPKPGDSDNQRAAADGTEMKGFPGQLVEGSELIPGQPPWGEKPETLFPPIAEV